MKVCSVLLIIVLSLTTNIFSQVGFTPHTITTNAISAESVYAVDVDGDGDMDVLSASSVDRKIAWYQNLSIVGIVNNDPPVVPVKLLLYNNYPNPFNPATTIEFDLPRSGFVTLKLYNSLGKELVTLISDNSPAGKYKAKFNANNLASGVYLSRLQAGDFVQTRKMVLLK